MDVGAPRQYQKHRGSTATSACRKLFKACYAPSTPGSFLRKLPELTGLLTTNTTAETETERLRVGLG